MTGRLAGFEEISGVPAAASLRNRPAMVHNRAMADSVLTLCPNCGRRLNVAQYQEVVTCSSCKQVSKIQYPWGVHQPKPEPPRQMVMQPVPTAQRTSNRGLWLVLIAGLVLVTGIALTVGVILPRMNAAKPPPPTDYFENATSISDQLVRTLGFPAMVQRLTIYPDRAEVEAWQSKEGVVKRYLVRPTGTTERRGGKGERTAAFDASQLELSRLPRMVDSALSTATPADTRGDAPALPARVFATPDPASAEPLPEQPGVHNVVVQRAENGAIRWRVVVRSKDGVFHVDYDAKGNPLEPQAR